MINFYNTQRTLFFLIIIFICNYNSYSQTTYNIDDPKSLKEVIYEPGDIIILKNGVYDTDERMIFLGSGTSENPVTFRAETPGGVIFTGGPRLTIGGESDGAELATGEYLVVDGFHWKGGYGASNFIEFRNGDDYAHHSTIQNCVIDGLGVEPSELAEDLADEQIPKHRWIVLFGTYNTVINCAFMNKVTAGAIVLGEYSYNAFPNVPDGAAEVNNSCAIVGHSIMNNYFYNFEKLTELYGRKANGDELSNAGDSETIRIGTSSYQMVNSNATVSNNYFVQSDGENEIITNKSKGNTYTNNTFRRCRGSLVLRHGSKAKVEGNYFLGEDVDGTGGIRISDSDHVITNNYIQDCITVNDFAKWNNGITFIGGGANADADCTTDNVSNGYQKSENIEVSNNTIINTNAPLFYNVNTDNNNDVKGKVENNLIYFADNDTNITPVISGDEPTSYSSIGVTLSYSGNVYTGTTLGETNAGFAEETGITATASDEIFTFSGTGSSNKGADLGAYSPTTDAMVGYGIGACFLDYSGNNITNGDCTIQVLESLTISNLATLSPDAGSYNLTVNANVSWTAVSNDAWISIDTNSASGNATVSVTVTENTNTTNRTGTVTFTQDAGGDDIVRTLTITQQAADPRTNLALINDNTANDNVTINYVFAEEVTDTKNNLAIHSLDKDLDTQWAGKGVGGEVIYDLGGAFELALVDFLSTSGKTYEFQIWVSTTGTEAGDFTNAYADQGNDDGNLVSNSTQEFKSYLLTTPITGVKYVKFIGYGQPARPSEWNTIKEIEFYKTKTLSVDENSITNVIIYPVPANNTLFIKNKESQINKVEIISLEGKVVNTLNTKMNKNELTIDTSQLANGMYFIKLFNDKNDTKTKLIIINH